MSTTVDTAFSHVRPGDTAFEGNGLRDFFLYRDLGVAAGTTSTSAVNLGQLSPVVSALGAIVRPSI